MNASKENADVAIRSLDRILKRSVSDTGPEARLLGEFLNAAKRKLPSEAAFAKAAGRKKAVARASN